MAKKVEVVLQPSHIKVFNYVRNFVKDHIYAPMLSEIAKGTGLPEREIFRKVEDLIQLRYLSKAPRKKRGLRVLKEIVNN